MLPVQSQLIGPTHSSASSTEFLIHTTFKNNGIIVGGSVTKGTLKKRQIMYLGPDQKGEFK